VPWGTMYTIREESEEKDDFDGECWAEEEEEEVEEEGV